MIKVKNLKNLTSVGIHKYLKLSLWLTTSLILILCLNAVAEENNYGEQLLKNPSFENGWNNVSNSPVGWSLLNPDQYFGTLSTESYTGKYSFMLTTKKNIEAWSWTVSDSIEVKDNKTYFVRTHLKYENVKQSYIKIEYFDDDNRWLEFIQTPERIDGYSGWKEYYTFIKIPKDIKKIRFVLNAGWVKDKDAGNATTWFDDIELIDPDVVNPTKYETELSLKKGESWQINNDFALFLESTTRESASISLIYKGYPLMNQIVNKGESATFEYDKNKLVIFKLNDLYSGAGAEKVWLKEILAGSIPSEKIKAPKLDITVSSPDYAYRDGNVNLTVSAINRGEKAFGGDVEITAKLGEQSPSVRENLKLEPGERKNFSFIAVAPKKPDEYKLTAILKTRYSSIKDEGKILVKVLNPAVTTFATNIKEENGIKGNIILGSPFTDNLVDWNLPVKIDVYIIKEKGKRPVYSGEVIVKEKNSEFFIPYEKFYLGNGRYVVTAKAGDMEDNGYLEMVGKDYDYKPSDDAAFSILNREATLTQLLILFIALVGVLSVRNHFYPSLKSLSLDLAFMGSGAGLIILSLILSLNDSIIKGMIFLFSGVFVFILKRTDTRVRGLILTHSHLQDFSSLIVVFIAGAFLIIDLPPGTANLFVLGIPVVYGLALNVIEKWSH